MTVGIAEADFGGTVLYIIWTVVMVNVDALVVVHTSAGEFDAVDDLTIVEVTTLGAVTLDVSTVNTVNGAVAVTVT